MAELIETDFVVSVNVVFSTVKSLFSWFYSFTIYAFMFIFCFAVLFIVWKMRR